MAYFTLKIGKKLATTKNLPKLHSKVMNIFGRYRNYKIGLIILILAVNVIGLLGPNHRLAAVSIFFLISAYLAIFCIFGHIFGRVKYGQVGCP